MPSIRIRSIVPNVPRLAPLLVKGTRRQLNDIGTQMVRDYRRTTRTWTRKPAFTKQLDITSTFMSVTAGTDNKIYGFVDEGTRPHVIRPKPSNRSKRLFFKSGYRAKTIPRLIGARSGGSFGNVVVAKKVQHPGTAARAFTPTLKRKWRPVFNRRMRQMMVAIAKDYVRMSRTETGR
jgi:hypothetical protein